MVKIDRVRVWFKGDGELNTYRWLSEDGADFKTEHDLDNAFFTLEAMEALIAKARSHGFNKIAVSVNAKL